jgi:hypothetical protein
MTDWLTSRETAVLLGISSRRNLSQVTGFETIQRKPGAPYNGYYYRRADVERVAKYRSSGQAWQDSYANRQQRTRKPSKAQQVKRGGRTVDPLTYLRNRAKIRQQETAVRRGELEPVYLPGKHS